MKFAAVLLLVLIFIPSLSQASPPSSIHAKYDSVRQELNIIVLHPVTNPAEHFIKEVVIYKNDSVAGKKQFDFQTSSRNQTISPIKIAAVDGDRFRIVATCNKLGSGETTIEVASQEI